MTPDWPALLASIQDCNAAYIPDADQAIADFEERGSKVLARLETDTAQAVLHRTAAGRLTVSDAGTRFSEGFALERISDILQDIDCSPLDIGGGRMVATGAWKRAQEVAVWLTKVAPGEPLDAQGHSLGAWTSTYLPAIMPGRIRAVTAWESPKAGNAGFWSWLSAQTEFLAIVNGRDPWAAWEWLAKTLNKGPAPMIWLTGGGWRWATEAEWPGADILRPVFTDHDTTTIIPLVAALAGR